MLQLGPRMGARLFFGRLCQSRGCGELTFPGPRADPPNRSDSRLLGKMLSTPRFRAGGTASLTQAFLSILVFGASPRRVAQRLAMVKSAGSVNRDTPFIYSTRDDLAPRVLTRRQENCVHVEPLGKFGDLGMR